MNPTLESCAAGEGTLGTKVTNYIGWVLDHEEHEVWAAYYYLTCGHTLERAGKLSYLSASAVRYVLERSGFPKRKRGKRVGYSRDLELRHLCAMLYIDQKLSAPEIGKMLGLQKTSVTFRLKRSGVKMRSRQEATKLRFSKIPRSDLSARSKKGYKTLKETNPEVIEQRMKNAVAARLAKQRVAA